METAAEGLREMKKYTLRLPGGKEYLHEIKCPVMVTGAAASPYFDPKVSTTRFFNSLSQLKDEEKEEWIAKDVGERGFQAKVAAYGISIQRSFSWLDNQFGIKRNKR